jgi:hypothetical protein
MSFEPRCPQCLFVSRELGQPTPCLLHVSLVPIERAETELDSDPVATSENSPSQDYDEPYAFGQSRPSVDRPGPFSLREYVRLQLLRTRIQANPSRLDQPAPRTQARSLSRR